jgi:hypothetical protein
MAHGSPISSMKLWIAVAVSAGRSSITQWPAAGIRAIAQAITDGVDDRGGSTKRLFWDDEYTKEEAQLDVEDA